MQVSGSCSPPLVLQPGVPWPMVVVAPHAPWRLLCLASTPQCLETHRSSWCDRLPRMEWFHPKTISYGKQKLGVDGEGLVKFFCWNIFETNTWCCLFGFISYNLCRTSNTATWLPIVLLLNRLQGFLASRKNSSSAVPLVKKDEGGLKGQAPGTTSPTYRDWSRKSLLLLCKVFLMQVDWCPSA